MIANNSHIPIPHFVGGLEVAEYTQKFGVTHTLGTAFGRHPVSQGQSEEAEDLRRLLEEIVQNSTQSQINTRQLLNSTGALLATLEKNKSKIDAKEYQTIVTTHRRIYNSILKQEAASKLPTVGLLNTQFLDARLQESQEDRSSE
jgi:hypothetical protein